MSPALLNIGLVLFTLLAPCGRTEEDVPADGPRTENVPERNPVLRGLLAEGRDYQVYECETDRGEKFKVGGKVPR